MSVVNVVVLLFYTHGKLLLSFRDGYIIYTHWAGLDLLSGYSVLSALTFARN